MTGYLTGFATAALAVADPATYFRGISASVDCGEAIQLEIARGSTLLGTETFPGNEAQGTETDLKGVLEGKVVEITLWCRESVSSSQSQVLMATYTSRFTDADAALSFHERLVSAFASSHGEPIELVSYTSADYDSDMALLPGATPTKVQSYFRCKDGTPDSEDFAASIDTLYPLPGDSEFQVRLSVRFVRPTC